MTRDESAGDEGGRECSVAEWRRGRDEREGRMGVRRARK